MTTPEERDILAAYERGEWQPVADRDAEIERYRRYARETNEDRLAALDADDGSRVPHDVAVAIGRGESPIVAFRERNGLTLRELAERTGLAASYLSEIERGRKAGSAAALARIADALGTTVDALLIR